MQKRQTQTPAPISAFAYTDYRRFLTDWFTQRKKANNGFSFQVLAQRAGFSNKGFLHNVMSGKKNLSGPSALQLAQAIGLGAAEAQYFECLVAFNQAVTHLERDVLFRRLQSIHAARKGGARIRELRADQIEYYSRWYHSAVRSLVGLHDFGDDWTKLAKAVFPRITARQARESVELLLRLGLLARDDSGRLTVTDSTVGAGPEILQLGYQRFQLEMNDRARDAVVNLPREQRHASGSTLGISRTTYERLCGEIDAFRRRLLAIAESDTDADECYQLTVNLFPLSDIHGALKKKAPARGKQEPKRSGTNESQGTAQ